MYYKSPFKSAIIREKQKAAFLGEIRCANSEKREKSKNPLFSVRFAARTQKNVRKAI